MFLSQKNTINKTHIQDFIYTKMSNCVCIAAAGYTVILLNIQSLFPAIMKFIRAGMGGNGTQVCWKNIQSAPKCNFMAVSAEKPVLKMNSLEIVCSESCCMSISTVL